MEILIALLVAVVVYLLAGLLFPAPWPLVLAIVAVVAYLFGIPSIRRR